MSGHDLAKNAINMLISELVHHCDLDFIKDEREPAYISQGLADGTDRYA